MRTSAITEWKKNRMKLLLCSLLSEFCLCFFFVLFNAIKRCSSICVPLNSYFNAGWFCGSFLYTDTMLNAVCPSHLYKKLIFLLENNREDKGLITIGNLDEGLKIGELKLASKLPILVNRIRFWHTKLLFGRFFVLAKTFLVPWKKTAN